MTPILVRLYPVLHPVNMTSYGIFFSIKIALQLRYSFLRVYLQLLTTPKTSFSVCNSIPHSSV